MACGASHCTCVFLPGCEGRSPTTALPLSWSVPSRHLPLLLPSNPKLTNSQTASMHLVLRGSSDCTARFLAEASIFLLLFTGPQGREKDWFFATRPGHAATEALQIRHLPGAVGRNFRSAPEPGHPQRVVCCRGNGAASFKPLKTSALSYFGGGG